MAQPSQRRYGKDISKSVIFTVVSLKGFTVKCTISKIDEISSIYNT